MGEVIVRLENVNYIQTDRQADRQTIQMLDAPGFSKYDEKNVTGKV